MRMLWPSERWRRSSPSRNRTSLAGTKIRRPANRRTGIRRVRGRLVYGAPVHRHTPVHEHAQENENRPPRRAQHAHREGHRHRRRSNRPSSCTARHRPGDRRTDRAMARDRTLSPWSLRRGSNPRPAPYEGDALPAELRSNGRLLALRARQRLVPAPGIEPGCLAAPRFELGASTSSARRAMSSTCLYLERQAKDYRGG